MFIQENVCNYRTQFINLEIGINKNMLQSANTLKMRFFVFRPEVLLLTQKSSHTITSMLLAVYQLFFPTNVWFT